MLSVLAPCTEYTRLLLMSILVVPAMSPCSVVSATPSADALLQFRIAYTDMRLRKKLTRIRSEACISDNATCFCSRS